MLQHTKWWHSKKRFLKPDTSQRLLYENEVCAAGPLTSHLHYVSRNDVPGSDPLDALLVLAVHLAHLRLVFLQSLDGVLRIALLVGRKRNVQSRKKVSRFGVTVFNKEMDESRVGKPKSFKWRILKEFDSSRRETAVPAS